MPDRPDSCAQCPLHYLHLGFCPDYYPANPKLAICLDAPGDNDAQFATPMSGSIGDFWEDKLLRPIGHVREEILITHTIRCGPPKGQYPQGTLGVTARSNCRQYDRVHDADLIAGGIADFDPNLFLITEHPKALFKSAVMTRLIERHIQKAFDFADRFRVCLLMGSAALALVAPELRGGIKFWHGHYFEGHWPGTKKEIKRPWLI